jgi:hypothetical protein
LFKPFENSGDTILIIYSQQFWGHDTKFTSKEEVDYMHGAKSRGFAKTG